MGRPDSALPNGRVAVPSYCHVRSVFTKICWMLGVLTLLLVAAWDNLDLGIPGACDQIVEREGYALGYSEKYEQPLWVSYHLTAEEVTNVVIGCLGAFHADTNILTGSATPADYAGSGYDRGHLAPAADMRFATNVFYESFSMANVSPQLPSFNRGVWKRLEEHVRDIAIREHGVWVVTGPVFKTNLPPRTIGISRVGVPDGFYKVLCVTSPPARTMGFLFPHAATTQTIDRFLVPIGTVETNTHLLFFTEATNRVGSCRSQL